jgi:hypothetical protein
LPKAYLECDLEWLLNHEFFKKETNKYSTDFFIETGDFTAKLAKFYLENRPVFLDKVIEKIIAKQDQIKAIGFHGSEAPIGKLLWFLIYSLVYRIANKGMRIYADAPIRTDGGKYYPIGYEFNTNSDQIKQILGNKYAEISEWIFNSEWVYDNEKEDTDDDFYLEWRAMYKYRGEETKITKLFNRHKDNQRKLLVKVAQLSLRMEPAECGNLIDNLTEDEKLLLCEMIEKGFVKKCLPYVACGVGEGRVGASIIPNFTVFTFDQRKALIKIYTDITEELKRDIANFTTNIDKFVKENLPKQLQSISPFIKSDIFYNSSMYIAGFAFYDGILYKPENDEEFCLLTLQMAVGN